MHCLDTSSLIWAWDTYPQDQFPKVWNWLGELIASGDVALCEIVLEELKPKSGELRSWLLDKGVKVLRVDNKCMAFASTIKELLEIENDNYHSKGVTENDILIVSAAKIHNLPLVSNEGKATAPQMKSRFKIQNVCQIKEVSVACISFVQFLKSSSQQF